MLVFFKYAHMFIQYKYIFSIHIQIYNNNNNNNNNNNGYYFSLSKLFIHIEFVIFKPLSYCFKKTIGFDVKTSFPSRPESRLIG